MRSGHGSHDGADAETSLPPASGLEGRVRSVLADVDVARTPPPDHLAVRWVKVAKRIERARKSYEAAMKAMDAVVLELLDGEWPRDGAPTLATWIERHFNVSHHDARETARKLRSLWPEAGGR